MTLSTKTKLAYARALRKQLTDAERRLWYWLRHKYFFGFKFRRQVPIGPYIVDFVCYELKLIIELDGGQHNLWSHRIYDEVRTHWLNKQGYQVKRYWNHDVLLETEEVLDDLFRTVFIRSPVGKIPPPP